MIGLSSIVFDTLGALYLLREDIGASTIGALHGRDRRISKYRTLDGGVSVIDNGCIPGDRTVLLTVPYPTTSQIETMRRLTERYAVLLLTTPNGAYHVCPEYCLGDGTNFKISLSFIEEV